MSDKETFIHLKYFSPFDLEKIPYDVCHETYKECFGWDFMNGDHVPLRTMMMIHMDFIEMKRGIMRVLMKTEG